MRTAPVSTASSATWASDLPALGVPAGVGRLMATYHWSESIGSTISPVRPQRGTIMRCGFSDTSSPASLSSASTALRAA